jgi:ABC-type uncharacterized transport system permease subunit
MYILYIYNCNNKKNIINNNNKQKKHIIISIIMVIIEIIVYCYYICTYIIHVGINTSELFLAETHNYSNILTYWDIT